MKNVKGHRSFYAGWLVSASTYPETYAVPVTAEDHREMAMDLLDEAGGDDTGNRIAAAQVHATLALTAPEAAGYPEATA